jgi:hypothetical protein
MVYMIRQMNLILKVLCPRLNLVLHLPFILHQADLMAARIEFEREWLDTFWNQEST